jgi:hypothetical protein
MHSVPPLEVVEQALTRDEAKKVAWQLFATDSPAVTELLLLAHSPDVSTLKRYQANMALEWFNPEADVPLRPADLEDPEPIRLLRLAFLSGNMTVRIAAGDDLARMLKPTSVWETAGVQ